MSKLKPHKRSRKHVTFRPCALDETIDINEPIPEEDESLYDDIYTTGSTGSTSSSPSSCPPDHDVPADAAAAGDHHEDKPHHYQGEELSVNLAWGVEHEVTPDLVHKSNARQSGRQAGAGYLPSLVTSPSLSSVAEVEETSGGREELLNCCTQGEECEERNALVEVDQRSSATSASGSSGAETFKSDEITELQSARQFVNNDADNEAIKKAKKEMANNEIFADMRHHVADGDDVDVEEQQVTSAPAASVPIASNLTVADNLNASVISNEFNLLARRNSYRKKFNSYRKHGGSKKSLKEDTVKYTTTKIVIDVPLGNIYESVEGGRADSEPIYEELAHVGNNNVDHLDACQRSIFEGASKDQILEYLEDAKERVEILIDCDHSGSILLPGLVEDEPESQLTSELTTVSLTDCQFASSTSSSIGNSSHVINRRNRTSNVSNSSTDSAMTSASSLETDDSDQVTTASSSPTGKCPMGGLGLSSSLSQLVERNDSGVGAETSKPAKLRRSVSVTIGEAERLCTDCEQSCEPAEEEETGLLFYPLTCEKCSKRRTERKEIIGEFVDTEFKYGRDLRIVREEFYRPMEVSGLLNKDQLKLIFLNLDELIQVNSSFSERLQDALDIATEQGDEDLTTVNIGKIFNDSSLMLNAFETYCIRHGPASLLLTNLEKEKELLRIFLRVSQMENALLRRMNLSAFLMVPVQRVTKYPLLLNRLYKVTPYHHRDRESLKAIQQKVELHLELINQQTKSTQSRTWRRISSLSHSSSHRRLMSVARSLGIFK
ncbi:Myosin-M heavy chain [Halotydeus destructor]|nr:Myosin-M heavy chain [Halotydeus destructor]